MAQAHKKSLQLKHCEELNEEVVQVLYCILLHNFTFLKLESQVNKRDCGFFQCLFQGYI